MTTTIGSPLARYFVQIGWKSGRILYYCAVAHDGDHAIELVTGEREDRASDIVASRAWTWASDDGPRVKLDKARSFRLGSTAVIDAALASLADETSTARALGTPEPLAATRIRPPVMGRLAQERRS